MLYGDVLSCVDLCCVCLCDLYVLCVRVCTCINRAGGDAGTCAGAEIDDV